MYYTRDGMPLKITEENEDDGEEMYDIDEVNSKVGGKEMKAQLCKQL